VRGRSSIVRTSPSLVRATSRWSMKSKSISKVRTPYGMALVVRPRAQTYSGTCHQWLTAGVSVIRTLPTICVHMCSVSSVSFHSS
jgi:hypothetical protein